MSRTVCVIDTLKFSNKFYEYITQPPRTERKKLVWLQTEEPGEQCHIRKSCWFKRRSRKRRFDEKNAERRGEEKGTTGRRSVSFSCSLPRASPPAERFATGQPVAAPSSSIIPYRRVSTRGPRKREARTGSGPVRTPYRFYFALPFAGPDFPRIGLTIPSLIAVTFWKCLITCGWKDLGRKETLVNWYDYYYYLYITISL